MILSAKRRGNLYFIQKENYAGNAKVEKIGLKNIDIWHKKLGHLNERDLKLMVKNGGVYGIEINLDEKLSECEICISEKQTRLPFVKNVEQRTRDLLEIVHSDVCGPMRHASLGGKNYFVTFTDDKSRWCEVYFVKKKSEILSVFEIFKNEVETFTGQNKGKFESRSEPGIFVGYSQESNAYRIYMPSGKNTIVSRDVKFLSYSGFKREYWEVMDEENAIEIYLINVQAKAEPERRRAPKRGATVSWSELVQPAKRGQGRPTIMRSGSMGRPRKRYQSADSYDEILGEGEVAQIEDNDDVFEHVNLTMTADPVTWKQASQLPDADVWRKALEEEYLAQIKNCTWEVVERPADRKIIGSRFVFCTKYDNNSERKKARLVAKGCSQKPGEDFYKTYSPVARSTSIRVLAALAAEKRLVIHQADVVTAYLHGELEESVYMYIPKQLEEILVKVVNNEPVGTANISVRDEKIIQTAKRWLDKIIGINDSVCALKKALYGLRQAGRQWHKKLVNKLYELDFESMPQDPCLFTCEKDGKCVIIAVYVDDMIMASDDEEWMNEIKQFLSNSFEIKDLGRINRCLGIEFSQDENCCVSLKQKLYTEDILRRFNMDNCNPVKTPMEVNCKLLKNKCVNVEEMRKYPYQSLIGALMYLAVTTRPDIAYTVNYLSQFNNNYDTSHWNAAKRVLRYLKGTLKYGLKYEQTGLSLFGVADADWGGNIVDYKSYSGFAFILAGAPISWEARKQRVVAQSTTESEYIAMS